MKPILLEFNNTNGTPLYIQLYNYLKDEIVSGNILTGEKLPSLRQISRELSISVTTSELAYNQLLVEGYVESRPQSGYYVAQINPHTSAASPLLQESRTLESYVMDDYPYFTDMTCFDFVKWKKAMSKAINQYSHLLLFESDPQGEIALRYEISKYVYSSRGVNCTPEQIVIAAGTQQLTSHLCRILKTMDISHIATENPGYVPLQNIFREHNFSLTKIPVEDDGIRIDMLPTNIPSAVYVSPSNQFPTGAVMPIGKRYQLLQWAKNNRSFILEDDYDSELRYFGKPIPALQGLDKDSRVVYLGSFSSTLFPAIKISYMVLPQELSELFTAIKGDYSQTCSKLEQLTLAIFMEEGGYYTNIRRLRNLYSQKLQKVLTAFNQWGGDFVVPVNTDSGINIMLRVKTTKPLELLCQQAKTQGLQVLPLASLTEQETATLIFYYNQLPLEKIRDTIQKVVALWRE